MKFEFKNSKYRYFHHPANDTKQNERAVEIPIIRREMEGRPLATLEVGNVLSQYFGRHKWTTIDLSEKEDSVINDDIASYNGGPYDLIISISTFEHLGIEDGRDKFKSIDAVENCMYSLLSPGGRLFFTVPVGYNIVLDSWLMYRWPGKSRYMVRTTSDNLWLECNRDIAERMKYAKPYPSANAIIVGEYISKNKESVYAG